MDKRFTDIQPMICENPDYGPEPPLFYVLEHYFTSHGFDLERAQKMASEYIVRWVNQESSNAG